MEAMSIEGGFYWFVVEDEVVEYDLKDRGLCEDPHEAWQKKVNFRH